MKMRKITAAVLAGVMIVLSGCGGNEETSDIEAERAELSEMSERLEAFSEELVSMSEEVAAGTAEDVTSEEVRESETTVLEDTVSAITSAAEESKKTSSVSLAEIAGSESEQSSGIIPFSDEDFEYPEEPLTVENLMKITMAAKLKIAKENFADNKYYPTGTVMLFGLIDADFDDFPELFCEFRTGSITRHTCRLYSLRQENFCEPLVEYLAHESIDDTGYYVYDRGGSKNIIVNTRLTAHSHDMGSTYTYQISHDNENLSINEIFHEYWKIDGKDAEILPQEFFVNGTECDMYEYQKEWKKISSVFYEPANFMLEDVYYTADEDGYLTERSEKEESENKLYDIYDVYIRTIKLKGEDYYE